LGGAILVSGRTLPVRVGGDSEKGGEEGLVEGLVVSMAVMIRPSALVLVRGCVCGWVAAPVCAIRWSGLCRN
jgi:hypothetical protein